MQPEWVWGFIGGLCIGTAAAIYLLINGRVMGASGILGDVVDGSAGASLREKLGFLAALVAVPGSVAWASGGHETHLTGNLGLIVVAGLLVGLGTRLANGCTSGHGVCGLSRLSPRGIAATLAYLLAGAGVMALLRHGLGVL